MTPLEALAKAIRHTWWDKGSWEKMNETARKDLLRKIEMTMANLYEIGFTVVRTQGHDTELVLPPESDLLKRLGRK